MKIQRRFLEIDRIELLKKSQQCLLCGDGKIGLDYLIRERRLSSEIITNFRLGYVPTHVKHQLAGRIIFPLFDSSNNLIALASRLVSGQSFLPVYWHESYEKSFYLYGISIAIPHIRKTGYAIVVEGQIDALQMHNHGFKNTVALCSTNFSDIQQSILHRYTEEIVMILDCDAPGKSAGQKGVLRTLKNKQYLNEPLQCYREKITFVELPSEGDPDDFLKNNGACLLREMINAKICEMRSNYAH